MALNVVLRQYEYIYEHLLSFHDVKSLKWLFLAVCVLTMWTTHNGNQWRDLTSRVSARQWWACVWAADMKFKAAYRDDWPSCLSISWSAAAFMSFWRCQTEGLLRHIAVSQDPWGPELHGMDINVIHAAVCTSSLSFFSSFMSPCSDSDFAVFKVLLDTAK